MSSHEPPGFNFSDFVDACYRLISFSGGTFLRGVQGNPNYFPILVQGVLCMGLAQIRLDRLRHRVQDDLA